MKQWIRQLIVIVGIIFLIDSIGWMNDTYNKEMVVLQEIIENKENSIILLEVVIGNKEKEYRDNIEYIAECVYNKDSIIAIGGTPVPLEDYESDKLYNAVINMTSTYDEFIRNTINFFEHRKDYYGALPDRFPVDYCENLKITSGFGWRVSPILGKLIFHPAIDIRVPYGSPVYATADGKVVDNWIMHPVKGKYTVIDHQNGYETEYAHLSRSVVREGDEVKKGQIIGYVGNTGMSTAPHLHYEIKKNGVQIDPLSTLISF